MKDERQGLTGTAESSTTGREGVMQPRWQSLTEAVLNVLVGLILSFACRSFCSRLWKSRRALPRTWSSPPPFAGLSMLRSYVLRRMFNRMIAGPKIHSIHSQPGGQP